MSTPNPDPRSAAAPSIGWRATALLPMAEAARIAGVSRATLYKFAHSGELQLRKLGKKTLVETASLAAFIAAAPGWRPMSRAVAEPQDGGRSAASSAEYARPAGYAGAFLALKGSGFTASRKTNPARSDKARRPLKQNRQL